MLKPRILVTGATGKTGRVVLAELLNAGFVLPLLLVNPRDRRLDGRQVAPHFLREVQLVERLVVQIQREERADGRRGGRHRWTICRLVGRGVVPYASFLVPTAPVVRPGETALEWWEPAAPASSAAELLERSARRTAARLVVPLRDEDVPVALAVARLADALPEGLTPLGGVRVCAPDAAGSCWTSVFLHPATLEAVA